MKKNTTTIRVTSYLHHVIWYDTAVDAYKVAIKKDGTDKYYSTLQEAYSAIEKALYNTSR